jgi:UDP:flavonoid glycosyltransferase YjiC (YdhE family)
MGNVVLFVRGTGGDLAPVLGIGSALRVRGHNVSVLTHCTYKETVLGAGLDFHALDTLDEVSAFLRDGPLLNTPSGMSTFFERHLFPKVASDVKAILARCGAPVVLASRHMSTIADLIVAELFDVPIVRIYPSVTQIVNLPLLGALCSEFLAPKLNSARAMFDLAPRSEWMPWLTLPRCSIATWPDWFAPAEPSWPDGIHTVGFVNHDASEAEEPPLLAGQMLDAKPPVLITGGTGSFMNENFYRAAIEGCASLGLSALVVTPFREFVPKTLPSAMRWFTRLPFAVVMPRVAVVIHHGGMGTTARAIASGTPQLILAYGADRPDTARRLERAGLCRALPPSRWSGVAVADALQKLLADPTLQARRQTFAALAAQTDSAATAAALLESSMANHRATVFAQSA